MLDGPLLDVKLCAWWLGDGAFDVIGLFINDGDNSTTGTFLKCSVGIRIYINYRDIFLFGICNHMLCNKTNL